MAEGIKTVPLTPDHENPLIVVTRYWAGHIVVRTEAPMTVMAVREPREVTIPLFDQLGSQTQEREAVNLRNAFGSAADVYVIGCQTPSGVRKHGMFAIPKANELLIEVR